MCRGSVVMALAITTPGVFGDLTNYVKSSNRGSRPLPRLEPFRTASEYFPAL